MPKVNEDYGYDENLSHPNREARRKAKNGKKATFFVDEDYEKKMKIKRNNKNKISKESRKANRGK